jgi:hypothetical protein
VGAGAGAGHGLPARFKSNAVHLCRRELKPPGF